jgi:hypothetical protein
VFYPSLMQYDSVGDYSADICELFADLFDSVKMCLAQGMSTVTNLIELTSYVFNYMENDVQVDAIYTVLEKVFFFSFGFRSSTEKVSKMLLFQA